MTLTLISPEAALNEVQTARHLATFPPEYRLLARFGTEPKNPQQACTEAGLLEPGQHLTPTLRYLIAALLDAGRLRSVDYYDRTLKRQVRGLVLTGYGEVHLDDLHRQYGPVRAARRWMETSQTWIELKAPL